jgi:hypothetical protein
MAGEPPGFGLKVWDYSISYSNVNQQFHVQSPQEDIGDPVKGDTRSFIVRQCNGKAAGKVLIEPGTSQLTKGWQGKVESSLVNADGVILRDGIANQKAENPCHYRRGDKVWVVYTGSNNIGFHSVTIVNLRTHQSYRVPIVDVCWVPMLEKYEDDGTRMLGTLHGPTLDTRNVGQRKSKKTRLVILAGLCRPGSPNLECISEEKGKQFTPIGDPNYQRRLFCMQWDYMSNPRLPRGLASPLVAKQGMMIPHPSGLTGRSALPPSGTAPPHLKIITPFSTRGQSYRNIPADLRASPVRAVSRSNGLQYRVHRRPSATRSNSWTSNGTLASRPISSTTIKTQSKNGERWISSGKVQRYNEYGHQKSPPPLSPSGSSPHASSPCSLDADENLEPLDIDCISVLDSDEGESCSSLSDMEEEFKQKKLVYSHTVSEIKTFLLSICI